jgi:hypothetical protein
MAAFNRNPRPQSSESAPGNKEIEGALRVSSEMIAVLNGAGFDIHALTPEQQSVAEGYVVIWKWKVEAKHHGEQELEATLYALVSLSEENKATRHRISSYTQKISVSVKEQTWSEWVKSISDPLASIQPIWITVSAIGTAVGGWLVVFLNWRRKNRLTGRGHLAQGAATEWKVTE